MIKRRRILDNLVARGALPCKAVIESKDLSVSRSSSGYYTIKAKLSTWEPEPTILIQTDRPQGIPSSWKMEVKDVHELRALGLELANAQATLRRAESRLTWKRDQYGDAVPASDEQLAASQMAGDLWYAIRAKIKMFIKKKQNEYVLAKALVDNNDAN